MDSVFLTNLRDALRVNDKDSEVLIASRGGRLFVCTSYLGHHSIVLESTTTLENLNAVISNETASHLSRSLSEENLSISVANDTLVASSKGVNMKVPLVENSNLRLESFATKYTKKVDHIVHGIDRAISAIKHSANDSSIGDFVLRGYHLTFGKDHLELMASNGSVMSVTRLAHNDDGKEETVLLNPMFGHIAPLLTDNVSVGISDSAISFTQDNGSRIVRIVSSLTSGTPFEYENILKNVRANPIELYISTKTLRECLKKLDFFTDEDNHKRVSLMFEDSSITIGSFNKKGQASVSMDIDSSKGLPTKGLRIVTSHHNLLGFLMSTKAPTFSMALKDSSSPIYLTDGNVEEVIVVFFN